MSKRIVIRSDTDNHMLFNMFKAFYMNIDTGEQQFLEHKHTMLEVSCILSGAGDYTCGETDYRFSPGSVFLHCSNEQHYFSRIEDGDRPSLLVLQFDPGFIWSPSSEWSCPQYQKLFTRNNAISHMLPSDSTAAQEVEQLLTQMFLECRNHPPAYDLMVKAKLMTILATLVRYFDDVLEKDTVSIANKRHLERMEQSMKYILSHLGEPLTLEQLAKGACMSRSYYSTIFKNLYGLSVWDYIVSQRIELAKYKLETSGSSITQISEECGFVSIGNFNRAFKNATGRTPREYRRIAASLQ